MCLNPITIKNQRSNFRVGVDKMFITVDCGDCVECRDKKRNSYYIRMYYEWQRYFYNGGSVWFITNSYTDSDLPHIDCVGSSAKAIESISKCKFTPIDYPCFDKGHLRDFLDRLLKLDRLPYFITKNIPSLRDIEGNPYNKVLGADMKHFVVCEYGHNTHRPHYHLLIFCPFIASAGAMKKLFEFCWSSRVHSDFVPDVVKLGLKNAVNDNKQYYENQHWFAYKVITPKKTLTYYMRKHGFVMFSRKGAQVLNPIGVRYLTKYMFKDEHFYSRPYMKEYADIVNSLPALAAIDDLSLRKIVHHFKDTLPFFLISNGFGADLEKEFETNSYEDAKKLLESHVSVPGDSHLYAVPQYIIRRLTTQNKHYAKLYSRPESKYLVVSYITEFGKKCLEYKLEQSKNQFFRRFKVLSLNCNLILKSCLADFDKEEFLHLIGDFSFEDVEKLFLYKTFLQNVNLYYGKKNHYYELSELRELCNFLFVQDVTTRNDHALKFYGDKVVRETIDPLITDYYWNQNITFENFDTILYYLDLLDKTLKGSYKTDKANNDKVNADYKYSLLSQIFYNNFAYV